MFKEKKAVFVTKDSNITIDKRTDIILSPEFYWVVKRKLPVKYTWQVKKMCDSIFEHILPKGEYRYEIIKKDDVFFIFAYDSAYIIDTLKKIGIEISNIKNVYFAQNELLDGVTYFINDKIVTQANDIFILLKKEMVSNIDEAKDLNKISFSKLSKHKIPIERYKVFVDKKLYSLIIFSSLIYIVFLSIQMYIYRNDMLKLEERKRDLFSKYNLPHTSFQLEAIKQEFQKKYNRQIDIRNAFYKLFKSAIKKGESYRQVSLKKDHISLVIDMKNDKNRIKRLKDFFKKHFQVIDISYAKDALRVELKYAKN